MFANNPDPRYAELGQNRFINTRDYWHYEKLIIQVQEQNDIISINPWIGDWERAQGNWYVSDPIT